MRLSPIPRLLCCVLLPAALLVACAPMDDPARTLRIGNQAEPASLDPHRSEGVPARNIQRDLFEGLVSEGPDGELAPGVAIRWEISDDGLTWTFFLREDARWSNGAALTAGDFVYSLRRAVTPDTGGIVSETLLPLKNAAEIMRGTEPQGTLGVRAQDSHTLIVELAAPTPYLAAIFTHPSTFPVYLPAVRAAPDSWTRPGKLVSNGAYRLRDWRVNAFVALERNPYFHDADNVAIERVEYLPIEDERAELARFEAGDLHITYGVPPARLDWLRREHPQQLRVHEWFGVYYLGVNTTRPPLDDASVRRALSLAIDRDLLVRLAGSGETPAYTWIPAAGDYVPPQPDWATQPYAQRVQEGRALLTAAGYDRQRPLRAELLYNTRDRDKRIMTAIATMWRQQLGVQATLNNQEWKIYLQTRRQLDRTQVFRSGWIGEYPDANTFAEILHSAHAMNEFGWHNRAYDALLERARSAPPAERVGLFEQAERIVQADTPLIPLFHYAKARLVADTVAGYAGNRMDHHYSRYLSWKDAE